VGIGGSSRTQLIGQPLCSEGLRRLELAELREHEEVRSMASEEAWAMCPMLGVRDVRAAVEYFAKRLGFEVGSVFDGVVSDEGAVYGIVRRGGAELHLQIRRRPIWAGTRERIEGDVYVRVPDAERLYEDLVGRGAEILRPPQNAPYGMKDFTVAGPEGHRLTFGAPIRPD
jgi:uncharacterized glyoxalase superfamily protein PhnB